MKEKLYFNSLLFFVAMFVFLVVSQINLANKKSKLEQIIQENEQVSPSAKEVKDINSQLSNMNNFLVKRPHFADTLLAVNNFRPSAVEYTKLSFYEGKNLLLECKGSSVSVANEFLASLTKSKAFKLVKIEDLKSSSGSASFKMRIEAK